MQEKLDKLKFGRRGIAKRGWRAGVWVGAIAAAVVVFVFSGSNAFGQQSSAAQSSAGGNAQSTNGAQKSATAAKPAAPPPVSAARAKQSKKAYEAGLKAESKKDFSSAYSDFAEAVTLDPRNLNARLKRDAIAFRMMQQHQSVAERDALADHLPQAENEMRQALALDPGDGVVRDRLAEIQEMNTPPEQAQELAGPVQVQPRAVKHTFDYRGDTKGAYEQLAQAYGLIVNFEQTLPPLQIRFRLPDADFETAAAALSVATHTFWVPMSRKTILVAEDTPAKRTEFMPEVTKTFVLPESVDESELTDTMRAVREVAGIQRTSLDIGTRELTVRSTPRNVAVAKALIDDLERARGEIVLEIDMLEVDRTAALNAGLDLPTSANIYALNSQQVQEAQQATTTEQLIGILQQIFGPSTTTIPPLLVFGGGKSTFLATLPDSAALNFGQTLSLIHNADRMLLRAQDSQPATFFVGERFPVDLQLLSASEGTTNSPGSVLGLSPPTRTDIPTGTSPSAVVAPSLTGNGILDMVVANFGSNTISVFPGNGDGTFGARTDIPVGHGPTAIVAADFNLDGKTDLAVVNQTDATVEILIGNGDDTFNPGQIIPVGNGAVAIATGDFNNDGIPDLAVVNEASNTVTILLGNGDGTFRAGPPINVPGSPDAIAVADINNDADLDLAIASRNLNQVTVLLGRGDGTFVQSAALTTGNAPSGIATGTFTSSGFTDVAISNFNDNTISLFFGNGDGTFGAVTTLPTGTGPAAIAAGDVSGDGIPDLVTANTTASTVSVLLGTGTGGFGTNLDIPVANGPVAMTLAAFNGGLNDLAVAAQAANDVTVLINTNSVSAALNGTAATPETPYPASGYEDIGLKVKATPRVHANGDVTLQMAFDITTLSGQSVNGIPVIGNRSVQQTIRLKQNETSVISGLLDREEMRSISGLPGLAQAGSLSDVTGNTNNTLTDTELIIAITPRLVHVPPTGGHEVYAGRGNETTSH
jgi:type II secretory pathway component GspD/PulD (secretin)